MGYLVCEKCKEYYKLEEGESPDDFNSKCECGGKVDYYEHIPLNIVYKCIKCGFDGKMYMSCKPNWLFCPQCKFKLFVDDICPICGFTGKKHKEPSFMHQGEYKCPVYECPNCKNSYAVGIQKEKRTIGESIISNSSLIQGILWTIINLFFLILIIKQMFFT